jgi:hypothetical protein
MSNANFTQTPAVTTFPTSPYIKREPVDLHPQNAPVHAVKPPPPADCPTSFRPSNSVNIEATIQIYTEFLNSLTTILPHVQHSTDLMTAHTRLQSHAFHQLQTLALLQAEQGSDLRLKDAANALLAKGNPPKTALFSACDQLGLHRPSIIHSSQPRQEWAATVNYKGHHSYIVTRTAPTKTAAEFAAFTRLIAELH